MNVSGRIEYGYRIVKGGALYLRGDVLELCNNVCIEKNYLKYLMEYML
jgi:hypothetical protein